MKLIKMNRAKKFDGVRALMIIHLVLVLLLPFMFTQMGGCQGEKDTLPLNLGPEVTATALDDAITKPLATTNPTSIQLGEAFVVSETQELGAGTSYAVLSDTVQSVIERTENTAEILLTVIETKQKYVNGDVQKTSTEIPYRIEKAPPPSPVSVVAKADAPTPIDATSKLRPEVLEMLHERTPLGVLSVIRKREIASVAAKDAAKDVADAQSGVQTLSDRVTYHGLKVSVGKESPPELVQKAPNCLGIPDCKLTVHRVSFDMVFWKADKPDRVHWDLVMSPDAPYLAAMLNKCVTGLAKLGGNQGDILVRQCLPVVNFRYVQQP